MDNGRAMEKRRVVFDVDDCLWPLNEHVSWAAGVDYKDIVTFYSRDNYVLSEEEKERLYDAYQLPFLHDRMDFYPGAALVACIARDPRFDAWLCSNSTNERSRDSKVKNLERLFGRDYGKFRVQMNLITMEQSKTKKFPERIWVLVDDSPLNALASGAEFVLMPRRPWNQSEWGRRVLAPIAGRVLFFDTIPECVEKILWLANRTDAEEETTGRRRADADT